MMQKNANPSRTIPSDELQFKCADRAHLYLNIGYIQEREFAIVVDSCLGFWFCCSGFGQSIFEIRYIFCNGQSADSNLLKKTLAKLKNWVLADIPSRQITMLGLRRVLSPPR